MKVYNDVWKYVCGRSVLSARGGDSTTNNIDEDSLICPSMHDPYIHSHPGGHAILIIVPQVGMTALIAACDQKQQQLDVVNALLAAGANVNVSSSTKVRETLILAWVGK